MEITSIHKYISLIKLADKSTEVMFAGQPCLYSYETADGFYWKINPVFAKLVYGANLLSDIPACMDSFESSEEAIADGLEKLHTIGAFNTEVDLPDDTNAGEPEDDLGEDEPKGRLEESTGHGVKAEHEHAPGTIQRDLIYVINKATGAVLKKFPRAEADKATEVAAEVPGHVVVTGSQILARDLKESVLAVAPALIRTPMKLFSAIKMLEEAIDTPDVSLPDMGILDKLLAGKDLEADEHIKVMKSIASGEKHYVDQTTGLPLINPDVKAEMASKPQLTEGEQEDYDKWEADVRAMHPDKKLKFKSRIEGGESGRIHTTSAEVSGEDRSYGVWDHDTKKGHVFSVNEESLTPKQEEKKEEIVQAIKKERKFMPKSSVYAIATAQAKKVAEDVEQIEERINKPQGHKETADPITDDSKEGTGKTKKMMGNKAPVAVIANILARKK